MLIFIYAKRVCRAIILIIGLLLIGGGVAGYIILSKPKLPVNASPLPVITPDQTSLKPQASSVDETANWKKLTTKQFSLNYPNNWYLYELRNSDFYEISDSPNPQQENLLRIITRKYPQLLDKSKKADDLIESIKENEWNSTKGFKIFDQQLIHKNEINVNGRKGIRYSIKLNNPKQLKFDKLTWIYLIDGSEITILSFEGNNTANLDKILSTFSYNK